MEGVHGVDVGWLHHSNKDDHHHAHAPTAPGTARHPPPPTSSHGSHPPASQEDSQPQDAARDYDKTTPLPTTQPKTVPKRPSLLGRSSADRSGTTPPDSRSPLRRGSWITSISSKFSSSPGPTAAGINGPPAKAQANGNNGSLPLINPYSPGMGVPSPGANGQQPQREDMEPYVPQPPETSRTSFLASALRRLSSGSQAAPAGKVMGNGGMCPRRVMNINQSRERCLVPELDGAKLRRVAFCVDVEIAGGPRYKDDGDSPDRKKRSKEKKLKEKGEGEALRNPDAVAKEKDKDGVVHVSNEEVGNDEMPNPEGTVVLEDDRKEPTKKKEKKKRSEAERKERKEKKRRKAEESGTVPMELTREEDDSSIPNSADIKPSKPQDRPTTDPLRIYRRCCQLRETPILKRISEQLSESSNCPVATPGVVACLNLTGSRLTLADMNTLGDWLAVVPVKKLLMEDSELTDEGVRVILAGLLAAKPPDYRRRRSNSPGDDENNADRARTGVVEKLCLKNNPKISREGWKHISLFIYMCRSLKAIDVSQVPFPQPRVLPKNHPSDQRKQIKVPPDDIGEILCRSLSERFGGARLEELLFSDCSLNAQNVRKIVDGVIVSGIQRLGLSHNGIDDESLEYVVRYLRSGVCHGLDLSGTDLSAKNDDMRSRMDRLCEGLNEKCPLLALSLADCNLSPDEVKPLFQRLAHMPDFRFIDVSHNHGLFASEPSALPILRKYIPQLHSLKRLHLEDVSLKPWHAIGLAEVLPEVNLAHLNILGNPALASAPDEGSQEEACALYASLMVAVRVSKTIIRVDIEAPSQESSEVVKALAKQVLAYCLRNIRNCTAQEAAITTANLSSNADNDVEIPDVLLHIVGHGEDSEVTDEESVAPDEDYIVGGTGLVKALNYCLLEKASDNLRSKSMPGSGTVTPRSPSRIGNRESRNAKAKTMSKDLLQTAKKLRARLQPALREMRPGDDMTYKRLLFLDTTLQGITQRFEEEYPECRIQGHRPPTAQEIAAALSNSISATTDAASSSTSTAPNDTAPIAADSDDEDMDQDLPPLGLRSRHNSDVSLASRVQTLEEGHIHRLGQSVRRSMLDPQTEPHMEALREQLRELSGDELRSMVVKDGWEETVRKIGANAEELKALEKERPEEFAAFKQSQIAAEVNAGRRPRGELVEAEDEEAVVD